MRRKSVEEYVQRKIDEEVHRPEAGPADKMSLYIGPSGKRELDALARVLGTNRTQLASELLDQAIGQAVAALPEEWPEGYSMIVSSAAGSGETKGPRQLFEWHKAVLALEDGQAVEPLELSRSALLDDLAGSLQEPEQLREEI